MNDPKSPTMYETPEQMDLKCCNYATHEEKQPENTQQQTPLIDFMPSLREKQRKERLKNYDEIAAQANHLFPNSPREDPHS